MCVRDLNSVSPTRSTCALIGAASLGLCWIGSVSDARAQAATQLEEISVAGERVGSGRAGQGVGLLRDLPPPYAGGQIARGGSLGVLGTKDVLNTPFSTVNFTQQIIQDQQARTAADTLVNDASVRLTTASNGFSDEFVIRGFPVQAQDVGLNGLYGLVSSNRVATQYIERIELLKGPGAFMYGIPPGGSVGGSINIVTKRALDLPFVQVTPQFIGAGNFGVHLDASTRAGENKEWGIRFNGLGRTGEATINDGNLQTGLGALSLDYQGERLRWALDAISQNDDTRNFRPQINFLSDIPFIPRPPNARSNWFPGTELRQRDNTIASFLEYDLTDWLTVYGGIGYRAGSNRQTFPDSRVFGISNGVDQFGNFRLINAYYDSYSSTVSGNAGAKARFDTGFVNHAMNLVFTGFSREDGYAYVANTPDESVPSNIYRPSPLPAVNGARIAPQRYANTTLTSVALADTMSVLDDTVLLTAGVRYQVVDQTGYDPSTQARTSGYNADATSPLAGIVVKPWKNVSLYANYAEGLTAGTVVGAGYSNAGAILAPFKSDQQEVGVKIDWGTVTTTAALFQISRPDLVQTAANALAYNGEQRNRGLELSAYGALLPSLRGFASATFLNPELTKPIDPLQRGNLAAGVPDLTVSAGLEWDTPWVPGLAVNGRVLYTSGSYLTSANTVRFPDWTRFDLGFRYASLVAGRPAVFRFNVENVADNRYWLTTGTFVTVAAPRTFVVSASFTF